LKEGGWGAGEQKNHLQRILEPGEGNYVLTVNQACNVESDEQDDGRETDTLGKKRKKK
jgi:hypothetical protein